jgi:hypothetical protein
MGFIITLAQGRRSELGEEQTTKKGTGTAGEPFVDADNGPMVLLNLLFPKGQIRNKGDIELILYHGLECGGFWS